MAIRRSFIPIGLGMIVGVTTLVCAMSMAADNMNTKPKERAVTYRRMGIVDYQNFLKNWDGKKHAVLYALIQTPAQYDALFHPAPVMGAKHPFAPEAELYTKEQILLVARVMVAPENMDRVFDVERVTERDQQLALHYRFNEPKTNATFSVKNYLSVRIPRHDYKKVIFFENGKQVGELNTAEGQWSVPAMNLEPNKAAAGDGLTDNGSSLNYVLGEILVGFNDNVTEEEADNLVKSYGLTWTSHFSKLFSYWVKVIRNSEIDYMEQINNSEIVLWARNKGYSQGEAGFQYILVQFNIKATDETAQELINSFDNLEVSSKNMVQKWGLVNVEKGKEQDWINTLKNESIVRYAELNYRVIVY